MKIYIPKLKLKTSDLPKVKKPNFKLHKMETDLVGLESTQELLVKNKDYNQEPAHITSELVQAYIDYLEFNSGNVKMGGWIFHPSLEIERVSIFIGDYLIASDVFLTDRFDVQDHFKKRSSCNIPLKSGFQFRVLNNFQPKDTKNILITIIPYTKNSSLRAIYVFYCNEKTDKHSCPQPPNHIKIRSGNDINDINYTSVGVSVLSLILTHIGYYKRISEFGRVLDWGSGAGRVTRHLAKCIDPKSLYGCDIDSEAIMWAQKNLAPVNFFVTPTHPPTFFEDNFFDVVFGISVMTHFDELTQNEWLAELHRITRPGAIILLSVMSDSLRTSSMPHFLADEFKRNGFASYVPYYEEKQGFRMFSEKGYYKEAYHSISYIERIWGKFFTIVEHVKVNGGQDLIILRCPNKK